MTTTVPPVTVWHTDHGIAIAITKPDSDTATVAALPIDYALSEFMPAVLAALDGYAAHRDLIDAVNQAILDGTHDE